jgi:mono/diheme cytochrome c family protein
MMSTRPTLVLFASLCLCVSVIRPSPGAEVEYNRDVRPVLAENCFACHGPDSAARKADLRLDVRDVAVEMGAIVPGKPDKSALVERIFRTGSGMMPPKKAHKTLKPAQKETLKRWIASGATYQPHWSLISPKRQQPPVVKDKLWVRNPIDHFILAELEKRGLKPALEADRRTLARRLSLDLTGLPPSPEEVETFVKDTRKDAYERYVDQLLRSPHWGEHRGRYWLDAARYADSNGIHFDNYREIWSYRDWVIDAFNRNLSFDRFTVEQLAGDLLPTPTLDQKVATGFNRCNITTNEGGVIPEEYLVLYTRDRTETVSQVWMGLTAGCAVCHDHKFDPLSQREFYQMAAFFNNTTQGAMDGNVKDTPPVIVVPRREDRVRWPILSRELAALRQQTEARKQAARADYQKWLATAKPAEVSSLIPTDGLVCQAPLDEGKGKTVHFILSGQKQPVDATGKLAWDAGRIGAKSYRSVPGSIVTVPDAGDLEKGPFSYGAWVKLPRRGLTGAVFGRMDEGNDFRGWDLWIEGNMPGVHIIHKWQDDAIKVVARTPLQPRQWYHLFITYDGSGRAAGVKVYINGALQPTAVQADGLKGTIRTKVPLKLAQRNNSSRLDNISIEDLRIYNRLLTAQEVDRLARSSQAVALLSKPDAQRTAAEKNELFDWWLAALDPPYQALAKQVAHLQQEEVAIKGRGTVAHIAQERPGEPTAYILSRGAYDKRRDQVKAATPKALPAMPADLPRNRLSFARWLVSPEHPLTARVTVNRFWQEVFGTGLVRTAGDFGVMGELPSHPELLDWLAVEFRESGWDVKKFFKLMVTSAAYRQSALVTPLKLAKDPENRLLSRGPRFRLDGETIRDYALAASGLLVRKLGGPSVKPYQPPGVWEAVAMIGSNTRNYRRDTGDDLYRRSLYTFWKRSAPPASMDIFNAPSRETCMVRRERTNTPLQALVTLNDPQFVEAARNLAEKALKEGGDQPAARIDYIARRLLARPFSPEELGVVEASLNDLLSHYKAAPEDAKKLVAVGESKADPSLNVSTLAGWTMLVNELLNLDEVLNK